MRAKKPRGASQTGYNARKDLLRKAVIDAAATLFAERGVGGVNFQDIASKLGISRPSIYYYFKSKEDILASLVEEVTVFSGNQAMQLASSAEFHPAEMLYKIVFNHAKWILEHPVEFRVIDRSESELPLSVRKIHDKAKRTLLDNFTHVIRRGVEVGQFRQVDARVTAFALLGMCNWTAWWYGSQGRLSPSEIATVIADLAVNSVRPVRAPSSREFALADVVRMLREDLAILERVAAKSS